MQSRRNLNKLLTTNTYKVRKHRKLKLLRRKFMRLLRIKHKLRLKKQRSNITNYK